MALDVITPEQCRAARAFVGMSQPDLAERVSVSLSTIANFENGRSVPYPKNMRDIIAALEAKGVEFTNSDQPGVRLKRGTGGPDAIPRDELNASNDD